ncbi:hypothetical protein M378DRAFT_1046028 [Amanita muscaria Koide BX008]|uniref:Uncharacterized protein n=1 Tax=Amanita muscaria (strain Koide BX008) TaxID=946122 RepID=A0A0C2TAU0_AMAMK|nr:hypothetical protein M378DRAFT_1046028 [Amanita muscaria Koide BX008]
MATSGNDDSQILLPGFNLPYNYLNNDYFASALDMFTKFSLPLTTLREFTMMRLMNQLTDKPDWNIKSDEAPFQVFDDDIANKWKNEALAVEDVDITQGMVDWCIEELRYKVNAFEKTGIVTAYNDGDVIKSDVAVSSSLRLALIDAVKPRRCSRI